MNAAPTLTELELDALTELVNLGVSSAATNLSELVREEVLLSVPKACVVTREQAILNLREHGAKRLVAHSPGFRWRHPRAGPADIP